MRRFQGPIWKAFERGMTIEMSGRHADGAVEPHFRFSVAARPQHKAVRITLRSADAGGPAPAGPMTIRWASSGGEKGELPLLGGPAPQSFVLPLGPAPATFVHFRCAVRGHAPAASGRPRVAFLDQIAVE
jgi:hypothetical protein